MIKEGKITTLPKVLLGNLGLHNACSYYVDKDPKNYPKALFCKKKKRGWLILIDWDNPYQCPKGYNIYTQFDNPMETLIDYADWIEKEHKDLSDIQLRANAPFIGRKRSARWENEGQRRGLKK